MINDSKIGGFGVTYFGVQNHSMLLAFLTVVVYLSRQRSKIRGIIYSESEKAYENGERKFCQREFTLPKRTSARMLPDPLPS